MSRIERNPPGLQFCQEAINIIPLRPRERDTLVLVASTTSNTLSRDNRCVVPLIKATPAFHLVAKHLQKVLSRALWSRRSPLLAIFAIRSRLVYRSFGPSSRDALSPLAPRAFRRDLFLINMFSLAQRHRGRVPARERRAYLISLLLRR